jgi:hypothetical protein
MTSEEVYATFVSIARNIFNRGRKAIKQVFLPSNRLARDESVSYNQTG